MPLLHTDKLIMYGPPQDEFTRGIISILKYSAVREKRPTEDIGIVIAGDMVNEMQASRASYIKEQTVLHVLSKSTGLSVEELKKGPINPTDQNQEAFLMANQILTLFDTVHKKHKANIPQSVLSQMDRGSLASITSVNEVTTKGVIKGGG